MNNILIKSIEDFSELYLRWYLVYQIKMLGIQSTKDVTCSYKWNLVRRKLGGYSEHLRWGKINDTIKRIINCHPNSGRYVFWTRSDESLQVGNLALIAFDCSYSTEQRQEYSAKTNSNKPCGTCKIYLQGFCLLNTLRWEAILHSLNLLVHRLQDTAQ